MPHGQKAIASRELEVLDLGAVGYAEALKLHKEVVEARLGRSLLE